MCNKEDGFLLRIWHTYNSVHEERFMVKSSNNNARPFAPLLMFGLLALALFVSLRIARYMVCVALSGGKTAVGCTFVLPTMIQYMPLGFLAIGCVLTALRLFDRR